MTDAKDSSSIPLLMSITGAIVVVAVGGWFFLDQDEPQPERSYEPPPELAAAKSEPTFDRSALTTASFTNTATGPATDELDTPDPQVSAPVETVAAPTSSVEVELRKARLAADAELLIYPADQSAFYYYGQVLAAEPFHALATAELDAVLAKVTLTVSQHMAATEYAEAYAISQTVATLRPEHELVIDTQRTLDQLTEDMVSEAVQNARNGQDDEANQLLDDAAALPGRSAEYFVAIRESINEIRDVRLAAERDREARANLAENEAKAAWMDSVRSAIAAGNLVSPAGASASDLLAENNRWASERAELEGELLDAILTAASLNIETYDFDMAELLIASAENYPDEQDAFDELRASLEEAYVTYESNQVKRVSQLVALKITQPRYPRSARMSNTTGWVEIFFTVAPDGSTEQIEIQRSEPVEVFDAAAVKAVDNWEFEPVEYRGQLINQRVATRLVFNVE
ncbi:MAG: energy transducer TonB [Woeseiaceae bacterium]